MKRTVYLVLAAGLLGCVASGFAERAIVGRPASTVEMRSIRGAGCYEASVTQQLLCYGSAGYDPSDCTGCGCQYEHDVLTTAGVWNNTAAACDTSPQCTIMFPRGACTGGSGGGGT